MNAKLFPSVLSTSIFVVVLIATFGIALRGQEAPPQLHGLPDDWTHHHVFFSEPGSEEDAIRNGTHEHWLKVHNDPRFMMQKLKQEKAQHGGFLENRGGPVWRDGREFRGDRWGNNEWHPIGKDTPKSALNQDWSMDMGSTTTTVGADNQPAKYSFSVAAPTTAVNCAGGTAPDFVVYNTGVAGAAGQADIIAYDNLYEGFCAGATVATGPQVYWAYNTGSTISTSVVLSFDGTQLAYINSAVSPARLVLLKWKSTTGSFTGTTHSTTTVTVASCAGLTTGSPIYGTGIPQGDTIAACTSPNLTLATAATNSASETLTYSSATATAPVAPTSVSNGNYRTCTAPCTTTITFDKPTGDPAGDTISSPFIDYTGDIIYVGDSGTYLHKFTGVFNGTPAETVSGAVWPAAVGGAPITSPVYDASSGYIYVTNFSTYLAEVNASTGAVTASANTLYTGSQDISETPLVDGTDGKVYLFAGGDGNQGTCNTNNAVAQYSTAFASMAAPLNVACMGTGNGNIPLYAGDFDNNFYSTGTGNLYVCGNTGGNATLYQIPITAGAMGTTVNTGPTLTSANQQCSPITEVYNTVATGGPYDWLYLGVTGNGNPSGCGGTGCVMNVPVTKWLKGTSYSRGTMVVDTHFNIEVATTAGTSGATEPAWPAANSAGTTRTDNTVTWTSEGPFTFTGFAGHHNYSVTNVIIASVSGVDTLERVTSIVGTGESSNIAPTWCTTGFGCTTTSFGPAGNSATFTEQGPMGINGQAYTGGTSAISIDNISTVTGASQIYFTTLGSETCVTSGTTGGCAVQASQLAP